MMFPCTAYFTVINANNLDESQRIIITKRSSENLDPRGSIAATIRPVASKK